MSAHPPPPPPPSPPATPTPSADPEISPRVLLYAGIVLVGCTAFLLLFGVYFAWTGLESTRWPRVTGTVVQTSIRTYTPQKQASASFNPRREYYPDIQYRYSAGGKEYTSSRYALGETHEKFDNRLDATRAAVNFRSGSPLPVFYDPADPSSAVLRSGATDGTWVPLLLSIPFGALGFILLFLSRSTRAAALGKAGNPVGPR